MLKTQETYVFTEKEIDHPFSDLMRTIRKKMSEDAVEPKVSWNKLFDEPLFTSLPPLEKIFKSWNLKKTKTDKQTSILEYLKPKDVKKIEKETDKKNTILEYCKPKNVKKIEN